MIHPDDRLDRARVLHEELLAEEEHRWVREDRLIRHSDQPYEFGAWYAAWRKHHPRGAR